MRSDIKVDANPPHAQFDEEEQGENYIKDRVKSLAAVRGLSILAVLLLIAQIVLVIIHLTIHGLSFAWVLLTSSIFFFIAAILNIYWSNNATKAYKANTELFQPRVNDRLTKTIYIGALLSALIAVVLLVNLLVQREYSPDFVVAHSAVNATWDDTYGTRTPEGISKYLRVSFWIQFGFTVYYLIYFLVVARTSFRCLKFSNQAMSYLVFLGNVLLLAFGLGVIYFADHALGYGNYPQIKAHFPIWNVRGLYFGGICVSAVALLGFLVDHRSWRVGFLVLSFLLLILIVLLGNFTGFAYRHINQTYNYYKGIPDRDTCLNRMSIVHFQELEDYGCPQKYLPDGAPCDNPQIVPWEDLGAKVTVKSNSDRTANEAPAKSQTESTTDQTQTEAAPEETQTEATPEETQPQAAPEETQTEAAPEETQPQAAPEETQPQAAPEETQPQAAPEETQPQAAPEETQPQAAPEETQPQAAPEETQPQAAPEETQPQATPDQTETNPPADANQEPTTTTSTNDQGQTTTTTENTSTSTSPDGTTTTTTTTSTTTTSSSDTATPAVVTLYEVDLSLSRRLQTNNDNAYCLNSRCCGLLGQLYTESFLSLANLGLLAMLAAILISIACYYFWFVKWVDAARDKRKDYVWLVIMIVIILAFVFAFVAWDEGYILERVDSAGNHL